MLIHNGDAILLVTGDEDALTLKEINSKKGYPVFNLGGSPNVAITDTRPATIAAMLNVSTKAGKREFLRVFHRAAFVHVTESKEGVVRIVLTTSERPSVLPPGDVFWMGDGVPREDMSTETNAEYMRYQFPSRTQPGTYVQVKLFASNPIDRLKSMLGLLP